MNYVSPVKAGPALIVWASVTIAPLSAQECVRYEPSQVSFEATVRLDTVPGPPNFASIDDGDAPEEIVLLDLSAPICVAPDSAFELNAIAESNVTVLQAVLSASTKDLLSALIGRRVRVSGRLFHSHTGHHRTRVLVNVDTLRAA